MPISTLPAVLAIYAVCGVIAASAAHAAWPCEMPVYSLAAGAGVALDRLAHGDFGGAVEALAAAFRG